MHPLGNAATSPPSRIGTRRENFSQLLADYFPEFALLEIEREKHKSHPCGGFFSLELRRSNHWADLLF
jgi:hypothetical protein